jgi:hypothetical protein
MERVAVDLDDEAVLRPEEVDLVPAGSSVGSRLGEAGGADEVEQAPLGLGPVSRGSIWITSSNAAAPRCLG